MKRAFWLAFVFFLFARNAYAAEKVAGEAASMVSFGELLVDERVSKLEAFLRAYDSPLAPEAVTFIRAADRHSVDWRLVVSIAGVESTFGKRIPVGSYNAWGWGIPTGSRSGKAFSSWDHGISSVTEGMKNRYVDRGYDTLEEIGSRYAASPAWARKVEFFMTKLSNFMPVDPDSLRISI